MRLPPHVRLLTHLLAPALALGLLVGPPVSATAAGGQDDQDPAHGPSVRGAGALDRARQALDGDGGDPGLALRTLYRALPRLEQSDPQSADEARGLLTRPTAGLDDTRGDGYQVPSRRRCSGPVCVHWVPSTSDAPVDRQWVRTSLRVVRKVYEMQVDELGYRSPLGDGSRGGDDRLDVYLADVGSRGLFGYCAPSSQPGARSRARTSPAYCVLDNDFSTDQFAQRPRQSLRVTAAHELFHAVQLAYDDREDPWLQESTATWMEERFADQANDNRRYLPFGQLRKPEIPLDRFDPSSYAHYGAWVFWEHLTGRFGDDIVREVWENAAAGADDRGDSSLRALRRALRARSTPLPMAFARYVAANLARDQEYEEGGSWPAPRPDMVERVAADAAPDPVELDVSHLSSRTVVLRPGEPGANLEDGRWAVEVTVEAPQRLRGPATYVVVPRADRTTLRRVPLDDLGTGTVLVPVSNRTPRVSVALVNGSARSRCADPDPANACRGTAREDGEGFTLGARLVER